MYYYLRVIASMFMENAPEVAESKPVTGTLAATPARTSTRSSGRGGVAVATRPQTAPVETVVEVEEEESTTHNWVSWVALSLSVIGTLGMGTIGAFWVLDLLQHTAEFFLTR
jgi:hypothetical protein